MKSTPIIRRAWVAYVASAVAITVGGALALRAYPGSFSWGYDVISALASARHNPGGYAWFAGALGISLVLLWPVVTQITAVPAGERGLARFARRALRLGLICGILVASESLAFSDLVRRVRKGHEILALITFVGLYAGVLALYVHHWRRRTTSPWALLAVLIPLVAAGVSEGILYLDQRHVGWLDHDWRNTGVPLWLSFAFWQWLAATVLWASLAHLLGVARHAPGTGTCSTTRGEA